MDKTAVGVVGILLRELQRTLVRSRLPLPLFIQEA